MKELKQVFAGISLALLSLIFVLGSITLAFSEGESVVAMRATIANTVGPQFMRTPGQPTFTPIPTQTIVMPTACPLPTNWSAITIQLGDDLGNLAQRYQTTQDELRRANCLLTDNLVEGATFFVPAVIPTSTPIPCGAYSDWIIYIVRPGDTLTQISMAYGTSVASLKMANCLTSDLIRVGQTLYVPNRTPIYTAVPTNTFTPSGTPLPTNTSTSTLEPTSTETVPSSPTNTLPPSATHTDIPNPDTATPTPTPTETPTPSITPGPPTPTDTVTVTPTPTDTASPTLTPEPSATPEPDTPTPSATTALITP